MQITRIVRLTFDESKISDFEQIFENSKLHIRSFPGCLHLELMKDHDHANVLYTHSKWISNNALNEYRKSTLFTETWAKTKLLFSDRPQAFSLISVEEVII